MTTSILVIKNNDKEVMLKKTPCINYPVQL